MDLKSAVEALIAAGWSEQRIADDVGSSQSTINRIKLGKLPRGTSFDVGQKILALADRETRAKRKRAA